MRLPIGIYKIVNTFNGKVYVGQAQNVYTRRRQHFDRLRGGRHENKRMQDDFNAHPDAFRWELIELCELADLNEREKHWINQLDAENPEHGYNGKWVPYNSRSKETEETYKRGYKVVGYHKSR